MNPLFLGKEIIRCTALDKTLVYRKQSFDVICTEEQINELVTPIVEFTSYLTGVNNSQAMPDMQSLLSALIKSKTIIARFLANARGRVVDPDNLSGISVQVLSYAGYFIISFEETSVDIYNVKERRTYKMVLAGQARMPLISKLATVNKDTFYLIASILKL